MYQERINSILYFKGPICTFPISLCHPFHRLVTTNILFEKASKVFEYNHSANNNKKKNPSRKRNPRSVSHI